MRHHDFKLIDGGLAGNRTGDLGDWQRVPLAPIRCEAEWLAAFENPVRDVRREKGELDHLLNAPG
ncbi:hypothetical protein [Sulfitobacter sp. JB4-11]|uniref:hypothetical protein n=1 Tax=Sulfitobacter rhodophyticola TaxID=3238304 RepID=UPI003D812E82